VLNLQIPIILQLEIILRLMTTQPNLTEDCEGSMEP